MAKSIKVKGKKIAILNKGIANYIDLTEDKIEVGFNIFKGITDEIKCDKIIFDWDANFCIRYLVCTAY